MNLIGNNDQDNKVKFSGTDSEKNFKKNKKKIKDWEFKNYEISYEQNSAGFRTESFDNLDWSDCFVVLGCSHVYGIGLKVEHTLASILQKKLGKRVINLGVPGSAVDWSFYNSFELYRHGERPRGIIHVWTALGRYSNFYRNGFKRFIPKFRGYDPSLNWSLRNKLYVEVNRELWDATKVNILEYSFFDSTANTLSIPLIQTIDTARDLVHPGIETNKRAAELVYQDIIKACPHYQEIT